MLKKDSEADLAAIRIASVNPILDPWIYILLRRSLFRRLLSLSRKSSSIRSSSPLESVLSWAHDGQPCVHSADVQRKCHHSAACHHQIHPVWHREPAADLKQTEDMFDVCESLLPSHAAGSLMKGQRLCDVFMGSQLDRTLRAPACGLFIQ